MANKAFDILIIGATGYTGRIIVEYLSTRKSFLGLRIALGGRSLSKVQTLVEAAGQKGWEAVYVDVTREDSVLDAVRQSRVVMSLAGPWWMHGSTVVRACARYGVHYLDLTGEPHWVAKIIDEYDYLAHKTGACIIPCAGFDSIPSDLAAYVSMKTLEKHLPGTLSIKSTGAHRWKLFGLSGGSRGTILSLFEEVPVENKTDGHGWKMSPVPGPPGFSELPKLFYSLPHIQPTLYGGFFVMSPINEPIVRRSWGLRERARREAEVRAGLSRSPSPTFEYEEFMVTSSALFGILQTVFVLGIAVILTVSSFARWILRWILPEPGEGPAREQLKRGWFELTNVSEAKGLVVKSVIKGNGDPGYYLTARIIVECAILLLDESNLTPLGRQGGILTSTIAFGDKLAPTLEATGKITISSEILTQEESSKTR